MPGSPYKYLDYYDLGDKDIFFGREPEIVTLLADILVSRLVVLFAKTGTGKTSLINAGVRPLLEERDYQTFIVQVRQDPVASVRRELGLLSPPRESLREELEYLSSETYKKPLVFFFDQFEEFFTYIRANSPEGQKFISDIADIYAHRDSGVHIVFSMREEWFHELDAFRDKIPTIFHNESNLRLRWFDETQAREAIKRPAEKFDVIIDDDLVEKLVSDLSDEGLVEPAQLQIVCDALWRRAGKTSNITLEHYRGLNSKGNERNIARQILYDRLEDEFNKLETEEQLKLLRELLHQLRTPPPNSIKYVRDVISLAKDLKATEQSLQDLLSFLEDIQLVRASLRDGLPVVELLHDYLVSYLDPLRVRVKAIWPSRILQLGEKAYTERGELIPDDDLSKVLEYAQDENVRKLILDSFRAELLARSSLHFGSNKDRWFDFAFEANPNIWEIFAEALERKDEIERDYLARASSTIEVLTELIERKIYYKQAAALLNKALDTAAFATTVIMALERRETLSSIAILEKALQHEHTSSLAQEVLEKFSSSRKNVKIASAAYSLLTGYESKKKPGKADEGTESQSRQAIDSAFLEVNYSSVISGLLSKRVILFLGRDINLVGRPPDAVWQKGNFLPGDGELVTHLVDRFNLHSVQVKELSSVTQVISEIHGLGPLYEELREVFESSHLNNPVYHFIASLPKILREKAHPPAMSSILRKRLIVITVNYDNELERAFDEAGEKCHVLSYMTERADSSGSRREGLFQHIFPDGKHYEISHANEYVGLEEYESVGDERHPVIIKLNGSIVRRRLKDTDQLSGEDDGIAISEDDYLAYLMRADISVLLPTSIVAAMRNSHYLFLGYSMRNWYARAILYLIWRESKLNYKSWAVKQHTDEHEAGSWASQGIEQINMNIETYVDELRRRFLSSPNSNINVD